MSKTLPMSTKDIDRGHVFRQVTAGSLSVRAASALLGISERQCYRLLSRFRADGDAGLIHGLRGRPSNNAYPPEARDPLIALYRARYNDYGPTLFAETIVETLGFVLGIETLRRWLIAANVWFPGTYRTRHRTKRPRRAAIGALVQIDGSHHAWFEDRGPSCCLFVFIDDAANRTYFRFAATENVHDALLTLRRYLERFGIFEQAYTDRGAVYYDARADTPFAHALHVLHSEIIFARSPQAKGRVERAFLRSVPMHPDLAVRELVANMLIHQDFSMTGCGPMVEIFTDRIEITNPGAPLVDTQRFSIPRLVRAMRCSPPSCVVSTSARSAEAVSTRLLQRWSSSNCLHHCSNALTASPV